MDKEERTARLMEMGHLVELDLDLWTGTVNCYPVDMGLGKVMAPIGRQSLQVMSKPWIKKVCLLRESVKRTLGFKYCYIMKFEGGSKRFVIKGAAKTVAESLDTQADRVKGFYKEVTDNERETRRIARQVISKNADHIWKTVSHLYNKAHLQEAPDEWKAEFLERVMETRFPHKETLSKKGIYYSFYNTTDVPVYGKNQKPYPGLVEDFGLLPRDILGMPDVWKERIDRRIPNIMKEYKSGGPHSLSIQRVERDLLLYDAFNPIPVPGHGIEKSIESVKSYLHNLSMGRYRERKVYREELAEYLLEIKKILSGPWAEERKEKYLEVFGG